MHKLLSLSMSAALFATAGAALAAPDGQARTEVVAISDLNLSSPVGANVALGRLTRAADRVCANGADVRQLAAWADYQACRRHALDSGVSHLAAPLVTARYFKQAPVQTELLASR